MNSKPLSMKQLRGKVVLVDFWTYSCVNCIRTLPHLRKWHRLYAKKGLVIIGVHAPEFDFEKLPENVELAINDFEIAYPVVLDNEMQIWNAYANHWWPRKLLVDKTGKIVHDHIGEGDYAETEKAIQKALRGIGAKGLPKVAKEAPGSGAVCYPTTPETYLGFQRGHFSNARLEVRHPHVYKRGGKRMDLPTLEGEWIVEGQYIQSVDGTLHMPYMAGEVNLVIEGSEHVEEKRPQMVVLRDGESIPHTEAGDDISFDGNDSVVYLDGPRMYRLLLSNKHHEGTLTLKVPKGIRLFAFTFGGACD